MREHRIVARLRARRDATPYGELRGDLTVLAVPRREDPQELRIFRRPSGGEKVLDRIGSQAERTTNVRPRGARRGELRDVLERDAVHALRLAEIAATGSKSAESEIRVVAGGVEREGLHVPTERDVFFVSELVGLRDANELEGARCRSGLRRHEDQEREEDGREPAHVSRKRSAILGGVPLVDVIAKVREFPGAGEVQSPVSGAHGVAVHLELFEGDTSLGSMMLGDAIELWTDDGVKYVVMVRRAQLAFVQTRAAQLLESAPPELVPLVVRSRGGALTVREYVIRAGDRLRLRAQVEAGLVRDDSSPVRLDEVI